MNKKIDIVRAWKDKNYRRSLPAGARPEHPAGLSFLSDEELELVAGSSCACSPSAITCITIHDGCGCGGGGGDPIDDDPNP